MVDLVRMDYTRQSQIKYKAGLHTGSPVEWEGNWQAYWHISTLITQHHLWKQSRHYRPSLDGLYVS